MPPQNPTPAPTLEAIRAAVRRVRPDFKVVNDQQALHVWRLLTPGERRAALAPATPRPAPGPAPAGDPAP